MPPVLRPRSPSRARLWSWEVASGTTVLPSVSAKSEHSGPSSISSTTTSEPASPNAVKHSWTPSRASCVVCATMTPLPAARPSALMTMGPPTLRTYSAQAASSVNDSYLAVGTPARSITSLANFFEPSICAALPLGPKTGMPSARTASATPATSGASGPITTRPMPFSRAKRATAAGSSWSTSAFWASWYMPPLPGATNSLPARGDWASLTNMACSRPPEPRSRMSTLWSCEAMVPSLG